MSRRLEGRVALVAGATRGAGRGSAVALGEAGATVYCTGRTTRERCSEYDRPETSEETAELVTGACERPRGLSSSCRDARVWDDRGVESILEATGNTPLVRLRRCAPANGAELRLKLEYRNPTGSMKDRMALAMIEGAERDGLLSRGETVVEYTGGSTGPALALVCRAKGYRALIVMADCFTEERFQLMRALGAELDVVPSVEGRPKVTSQDIRNMVACAAELAAKPGTTPPTSSTTRTSFPITATGSAARSGTRAKGALPRSATGWGRRAR